MQRFAFLVLISVAASSATAAGKDERKLILVRLLQVPPSEILAEK